MPAGGKRGSSPPPSAAAMRPQSGWWPTTTTLSPRPATASRTPSAVAPGASRSSDSDVDPVACASSLAGLAGAQERARQDDIGSDAVVAQALAELLHLLAPLVAQRAELVRVAGHRIRVPNQVELHPLAG